LYEEPFVTAGIGKNRFHAFVVSMKGQDWYSFLKFLDDRAEAGGPIVNIRKFVLFAEEFRRQLAAQGF
jgi:hypothetical protein